MTFQLARTPTPERTPVTLALSLVVDPENIVVGDLHLEGGQLHFWDGQEAHLQKALMLLKFVKGEWFLNVDEGVPYFTHVFVHNPNLRVIRQLFKQALLATPGSKSVKSLNLSLDRPSRGLTITFELVFDDGTVLSSADYPPFVLRLP